jgi:hypothetical protein
VTDIKTSRTHDQKGDEDADGGGDLRPGEVEEGHDEGDQGAREAKGKEDSKVVPTEVMACLIP